MIATAAGDVISGALIVTGIVVVALGLLCFLWYWDERHWK